ncbi:MAG: FecR family protein [Gemmatimonadaceae bacterium]
MALTIPGLNAELLTKLKSGDLGALEQFFRAAYPVLIAKARETLDDDGAAGRVVERLIPGLFAQRGTFASPEAFSSTVESAVHEAAVRERSRLAGLRKHGDTGKKHTTTAPSVDDVWQRVTAAIQGPGEEAHAQALKARERALHGAGAHIKEVNKTRPWYFQVLAVLGLTGAVALGIVLYQKRGEVERLTGEVRGSQVRELKTGTGQRGSVTLDDSTTAALGSDSRIAIPLNFAERGVRGIGLTGAAEFTIKADPMPFWIIAGNTHLTAVGGETFAVRGFPSDSAVIIRVKAGNVKVNVREPEESEHTLSAGQSLLIKNDGTTATPTDVQLAEALGYLDGTFTVNNKPLQYALAEIRRWYGTDLTLKDRSLGSRMVTLTAPLTSSTEAIKAVENAAGLKFEWEKQTMVLVDTSKKGAS